MTASRHKRIRWILLLGLLVSALTGCSNTSSSAKRDQAGAGQGEQLEENSQEADTGRLYILLYVNEETEKVFLQDVDSGKQGEYKYNGGTYFRDQYGELLSRDQMETGELVEIQRTDDETLSEVKVSGSAYIYDGITDFSIDDKERILTVGDSNYFYDEGMKVFSDSGILSVSELNSMDTICIRGEGKEVLTIVVTKGHGTIAMKNTSIFEGGMVTVGNVAAQAITPDMRLDVPEGSYTFAVANEGYGGSREITVKRSQELIIDLNELKGEGPKNCSLKINVTPSEAEVTINGGKVDCSGLLDLQYGVYSIAAKAEGYQSYKGNLVVNSPEAAVTLELKKDSSDGSGTDSASKNDSDTDENSDKTNSQSGSTAGSRAGSLAGSKAGSGQKKKANTGSGGSTTTGSGTSGAGLSDSVVDGIIDALTGAVKDKTSGIISNDSEED